MPTIMKKSEADILSECVGRENAETTISALNKIRKKTPKQGSIIGENLTITFALWQMKARGDVTYNKEDLEKTKQGVISICAAIVSIGNKI